MQKTAAIPDEYRDIPFNIINDNFLIKYKDSYNEKDISNFLYEIKNEKKNLDKKLDKKDEKEFENKVRNYIKSTNWRKVIKRIILEYPLEKLKEVTIFDTPGVGAEGSLGEVTRKYIKNADAIIFVKALGGQDIETTSFKNFLEELKNSIKSFLKKIINILHTGVSSAIGTIASEIFGPIVSTFKKLSSLIKQGVSSLMEAIRYLRNKENKNKPFSIKVAQVGKIVTVGLVAGGAIFLGDLFEKLLLSVPGMQIELPLLGSLANIIGMFLASLVSGLIGAISINLIDKFIAKKQKAEATKAILEKGNQVIIKQHQIQIVNEVLLERAKESTQSNISERYQKAESVMRDAYKNIMEDFVEEFSENDQMLVIDEEDQKINEEIDKINDDLDDLIGELK